MPKEEALPVSEDPLLEEAMPVLEEEQLMQETPPKDPLFKEKATPKELPGAPLRY